MTKGRLMIEPTGQFAFSWKIGSVESLVKVWTKGMPFCRSPLQESLTTFMFLGEDIETSWVRNIVLFIRKY